MTDKKPDQEQEVPPKGVVEVDEKDLDEAEGGISSYSVPTDSFSLNFTRNVTTDPLTQKVAPTSVGPPDDNKTI